MTANRLGIGIIGTGNISSAYLKAIPPHPNGYSARKPES